MRIKFINKFSYLEIFKAFLEDRKAWYLLIKWIQKVDKLTLQLQVFQPRKFLFLFSRSLNFSRNLISESIEIWMQIDFMYNFLQAKYKVIKILWNILDLKIT